MNRALPNPDPRRSERGFTMALMLAMAVVMGIMLLKAEPKLEAVVQRENEAELIFRGEAIANALKIYKAKSGRYPQKLDDLMKTRPLILRQPYKDPMTKDGEWEYVYQVQPGATGDTTGLPFVGVRSKSLKDSIHVYQNKTLVHDWIFSAEPNILGLPGSSGGGKGGAPQGGPGGKGDPGPASSAPTKP
ncbi:MAG TPA: type II secretion system protein [Holophagaceae bacterium]|nr:type II secretion system protein [Holophagaceae bacterium]